jgi:hypothetical protein
MCAFETALWGSGIDKRFKAFVLMAGGMSDELDLKTKEAQDYRQKIGPAKFDAFTAKNAWLDSGKLFRMRRPPWSFYNTLVRKSFSHLSALSDTRLISSAAGKEGSCK